jgi:hypothetical protein
MTPTAVDAETGLSRWWLAEVGRAPVGPLSHELLVQWFNAGLLPADALVCEVGGQTWRPASDLTELGRPSSVRRARFDPSKERCMLELEPLPPEREPEPVEIDELLSERHHSVPPQSSPSDVPSSDPCSEVTRVAVPKPLRAWALSGPRGRTPT